MRFFQNSPIFILIALIFISIIFVLNTNKGENKMLNNTAQANENNKILVAYFSRTGEQYSVGNIKEGNTAIVAKMIADKTGADLFEIKVKEDNYPKSYDALTQYALKEKKDHARPELEDKIQDFDKYNTIFIGYPNWWGDMPMPVYTFLESYNLKGKTLHHFATHEGSGGVKKEGFSIYGHTAQNDRKETDRKVEEWLKTLGLRL